VELRLELKPGRRLKRTSSNEERRNNDESNTNGVICSCEQPIVSQASSHAPRADYTSARFRLLIDSSISWVFLKPIVAQSTPAFSKANRMAFTRSS